MRKAIAAVAACLVLAAGAARGTPAGQPQPMLPTATMTIDTPKGLAKFTVEVASDSQTQERGLMWRRAMAPNAGMLFDFHTPRRVAFWMKNTILPLDMLFIRADGTVAGIAADTTPMSTTPIPAPEPVRAVLEINAGRCATLGIKPGVRVHGSVFGP